MSVPFVRVYKSDTSRPQRSTPQNSRSSSRLFLFPSSGLSQHARTDGTLNMIDFSPRNSDWSKISCLSESQCVRWGGGGRGLNWIDGVVDFRTPARAWYKGRRACFMEIGSEEGDQTTETRRGPRYSLGR